MAETTTMTNGHAIVNGLSMYYELYGKGPALVLIHGGGSTIQSTFSAIIPKLVADYRLIAMELQNHGRSGSRDIPETFEQDADDVAALVSGLGIKKASFLGFSNGGNTALQIAMRHPGLVESLIVASTAVKRNGFVSGFFESMKDATLSFMPADLQVAFLKVNPDRRKLLHMFEKDRDRMIAFNDWKEKEIQAIRAPTLVISADKDVVVPEHAVHLHRLIPTCQLLIVPGGHGDYLEERCHWGSAIPEAVASLMHAFISHPYPPDA